MQIHEIMKEPVVVEPEDYATRIRALLRDKTRIVVVKEDDRVLGIITRKDVMLVTSTKSNLKAREIMSAPVLVFRPDEEVHEAGRKMINMDVYSALVMENNSVLGIVHMEEILQSVYRPTTKKVSDIMTADVVSCDVSENVVRVWNLMEYHNLTGLPVTREVSSSRRRYKKLEGFVTRKDILRSGTIRPGEEVHFSNPPPIEKAMTRTPRYVRPHDSVDACVNLFKKHDIGRLPVIRDGYELIGIVDREDVLTLYV
ncbi:MAG: CBS domain-containing protein [Theionarchaea archaeon]|nr:CBS domain-containing protein [Theionarchaea archaeon]MBU7000131.1 CBS domain-containing protein [Theionarchaea archaeon]MBU7020848.1 CBS domain-containing protein [Theionarchaea archaeon]MBU7033916.1 CBS domain-containing protein [Theionarchaea archaeon]MBU7039212.1 CBS domain-containing protein [Theionarchaea archaeon]